MAEEKKAADTKKKKLVKGRHKSAIKRHRQSLKRQERNRSFISEMRSAMKKVRQAVAKKEAAVTGPALKRATSLLHKAAAKGIIHKKNASRNISRLSSLTTKSAA